MEIELKHTPSFGVARCKLAPGEQIKVEAGSMMAHTAGISLEAKMEGGMLKSLKRSILGGESLYVSTYTAPAEGGWVDVAAKLPGDLKILPLDGATSWIVERGNWLASSADVKLDTKWQGFKMMVGGEGGFMAHLTGIGQAVVASYGAIQTIMLGEGEQIIVDTNHLLAFVDTINYEVARAVEGKTFQSMKSGEGLVFRFTGPGEIWTQTRNQQQLLAWISNGIGSRE